MNDFVGGCHCGRIMICFSTTRKPQNLTPRACRCDFCSRHGAAYLSDPAGRIGLTIAGDDCYRFGFGITDFHICRRCGVLVVATSRANDGSMRGVVNMRALDDAKAFKTLPEPMNFEGESIDDRENRRRAHWTPITVHISTRSDRS
jgi:hypothetical protein